MGDTLDNVFNRLADIYAQGQANKQAIALAKAQASASAMDMPWYYSNPQAKNGGIATQIPGGVAFSGLGLVLVLGVVGVGAYLLLRK